MATKLFKVDVTKWTVRISAWILLLPYSGLAWIYGPGSEEEGYAGPFFVGISLVQGIYIYLLYKMTFGRWLNVILAIITIIPAIWFSLNWVPYKLPGLLQGFPIQIFAMWYILVPFFCLIIIGLYSGIRYFARRRVICQR